MFPSIEQSSSETATPWSIDAVPGSLGEAFVPGGLVAWRGDAARGRHSVAVMIPCFDEEAAIGKVIADFRAALPDAVIYVYDNNSTDRTQAVARTAGAVV